MLSSSSLISYQTRRAILMVAAALSGLGMTYELTAGSHRQGALVRASIGLVIVAGSAWELSHNARTEFLAMFLVGVYGVLGIVDSYAGTELSAFDPGTALAFLILIAVIHVITREMGATWPVMAVAWFIAAFAVVMVLLNDMPAALDVGFLILGGPGQAIVLWLIWRLIEALAAKSEVEARHARIQLALAGCSQALLSRGTVDPLNTALEALLGATEADYAYIDVTRIDGQGRVLWEIVAEAPTVMEDDHPDRILSGDYGQLEGVVALMKTRQPAQILAAELPSPIREIYATEGIKAEAIAPIFIGDRWMGTLGYADHARDGDWTDIEIEGLMRAAEMVGAYWEREAAREGLVELAHAKDRFIAAVSHELRTPLAAVVGFAGELVRGLAEYSEEEVLEMVSLIFTQSLEVSQLVDDLLTAERAASGNLTVQPESLSLLGECQDIARSVSVGAQVTITGDDVYARADRIRTRQIMRNLLTNADRYGGGQIRVEVSAGPDTARISVMDNGRGVAGLDEERIFDAYYRSEAGSAKPDSVGLGLSVARQLARLMNGDLTYDRLGGWTRFELSLPLAGALARLASLD